MIRVLWAALLLLVSVTAASAQGNQVNIACLTGSTPPWAQCSASNPFPVTIVSGGGSGGTSSAFNAAFPANGTAVGMSQGGNMVAFTGTSGNLNVNIAAGGIVGATSNASSGVATSSTNLPTVSYNYGFNGATWDQLQVSATKNLLIDTPTTSSNLYAALTAAVPALVATAYNTCSYSNGTTQPLCMDLNGNLFANISKWGGTLVVSGTGAQAAGSPRVTVATDQATNAGAALVKGGVGVVNGGSTYQHVAASQTAAVLQTSTGAIGDYLSHCVIYPVTTAAGSVTVFDNTNAAGTNVIEFATGTLSNLAPIAIPVGAVSTSGAWKVTTGANETVVCYGKFS